MRRGNILPIAVMAFALVAFLFVMDYSINSSGKWPWSVNKSTSKQTEVNTNTWMNVNTVVNTNSSTNVNSSTNTNTQTNQNANTNTVAVVNTNTTTDPTDGWVTYNNTDVGYTIKHPSSWTVDVTDGTGEMLNEVVKYIVVKPANDKYALILGVKKSGDTFLISDRSGVGAGDFTSTASTIILSTTVQTSQLVYQNKVKEWYAAPNGPANSLIGTHTINATINEQNVSNYDTTNLTGVADVATAKTVLTTLTFTK